MFQRGGWDPIHRPVAARKDLAGAADSTGEQRRAGALPGYRFRRLHAAGAGNHEGPDIVPGELDEFAAGGRSKDRWN